MPQPACLLVQPREEEARPAQHHVLSLGLHAVLLRGLLLHGAGAAAGGEHPGQGAGGRRRQERRGRPAGVQTDVQAAAAAAVMGGRGGGLRGAFVAPGQQDQRPAH